MLPCLGLGIVFDLRMPIPRPQEIAVNRTTILINCPWTVVKINAPMLATVGRIVHAVHARAKAADSEPPVLVFRVFAGIPREQPLQLASLRHEIYAALKGSMFPSLVTVQVFPHIGSDTYLRASTGAHLALDAFPFGGCNTVMVGLYSMSGLRLVAPP